MENQQVEKSSPLFDAIGLGFGFSLTEQMGLIEPEVGSFNLPEQLTKNKNMSGGNIVFPFSNAIRQTPLIGNNIDKGLNKLFSNISVDQFGGGGKEIIGNIKIGNISKKVAEANNPKQAGIWSEGFKPGVGIFHSTAYDNKMMKSVDELKDVKRLFDKKGFQNFFEQNLDIENQSDYIFEKFSEHYKFTDDTLEKMNINDKKIYNLLKKNKMDDKVKNKIIKEFGEGQYDDIMKKGSQYVAKYTDDVASKFAKTAASKSAFSTFATAATVVGWAKLAVDIGNMATEYDQEKRINKAKQTKNKNSIDYLRNQKHQGIINNNLQRVNTGEMDIQNIIKETNLAEEFI